MSATRPSYPWQEGDALFASELNAAIASGGWPGGPFLPLTGGTLGSGTGAPVLAFNGASGGTGKGLYWQTPGVTRWQLVTNTSEDIGLYAYDASGAFLRTAWLAHQSNQTIDINFRLASIVSNATVSNGVTGNYFIANNTGAFAATGHRFEYTTQATDGYHDTAVTILARSNTAFSGSTPGQIQGLWIEVESPIDTTHGFNGLIGELNYVNRGVDAGFKRDRALPGNNSGGLLFVPEFYVASNTGGEGKNVGYGFSVCHSGAPNSTGFPVKMYIGYNVEPNSNVGLTGRAFYASGDITGVSSQYPYGPFQVEGTWLHGFDHTLAVYTDNHAQVMKTGQGLAWVTGTTGTPGGTATITGTGSGADASITLAPAGAGSVALAGKIMASVLQASTTYANDAAAASGGVAVGQFYRNGSVVQVRVA